MYIYKYHMTQFVAIEWQLVAFRIRKMAVMYLE